MASCGSEHVVFAQLYGPYLALHRTTLQERPPADFLLYCNVLSHWSCSVSRKASNFVATSLQPLHEPFKYVGRGWGCK